MLQQTAPRTPARGPTETWRKNPQLAGEATHACVLFPCASCSFLFLCKQEVHDSSCPGDVYLNNVAFLIIPTLFHFKHEIQQEFLQHVNPFVDLPRRFHRPPTHRLSRLLQAPPGPSRPRQEVHAGPPAAGSTCGRSETALQQEEQQQEHTAPTLLPDVHRVL